MLRAGLGLCFCREESRDGLHRKKQTVMAVGKRNEPKVLVELDCVLINRINNNGNGCDLGGVFFDPLECIHQQQFAYPVTMVTPVNREAAEKRRGNDWIRRKLSGYLCGQIAKIDTEGGKRVIAENGFR